MDIGEIATRMGMVPDPPSPPMSDNGKGRWKGSEMSFREAKEDNIRFIYDSEGLNWFFPHCCICGAEVPTWSYRRGIQYKCRECKEKIKAAERAKTQYGNQIDRYKRLERAIARIQKNESIKKYESAIEMVKRMILEQDHAFDSTEEVMVALVLLKNGIQFRHQVKFGTRYTADFVLDDMKIVLEVDGDIYHGKEKQAKQQIRDDLIIAALGPTWEVLRIKTSALNQNVTKLPKAIKAVVKKREMYRAHNDGQLPKWYNIEG